jgi:hypothetical protein
LGASTVLDPADGHVIAGIRGRPLLWLPDGSLIAKTSLALLQGRYLDPGVMMLWKPGSPERVLARGYIEVANSPVLAPSGTAIACICVDISSDRSADSGEVVLRVPLDGSAPDRVAISLSGDFYATAWVDDASILVLNDRWLTRVWVGGKPRPVMIQLPGIEARMVYGRLAAMAGGVAVLVPTETLAKIDPLGHAINNELLVVDHEGRMRLVSLIPSVGGPPPIFAAPDGRHAIILADPQLSLQAPTDMFLLDSP